MKLTTEILAMYLGAPCMYAVIVPDQEDDYIEGTIGIRELHSYQNKAYRVHPILRKLEDMTEEEKIQVWELEYGSAYADADNQGNLDDLVWNISVGEWHVNTFLFLLSKGFDLFNLIDDGSAIDSHKQ